MTGDQLGRLMFPCFDAGRAGPPLATGIPASPGAAVGAAVFDSAEAVRRSRLGEQIVLVRRETSPDDLPGMIAASAVLTGRGGETSHAAVVARIPDHADRTRRLDVRANADTPRTPPAPAGSGPTASVCAARSTCSSESGATSSRR